MGNFFSGPVYLLFCMDVDITIALVNDMRRRQYIWIENPWDTSGYGQHLKNRNGLWKGTESDAKYFNTAFLEMG